LEINWDLILEADPTISIHFPEVRIQDLSNTKDKGARESTLWHSNKLIGDINFTFSTVKALKV